MRQEPGHRTACALPYEPYCDGGVSADGKRITLRLKAGTALYGRRASGLPFNIYRYTNPADEQMQAGTYAVAAGDTLDIPFEMASFANGQYNVAVHAPNGFYRHYKGRENGLRVEAACHYLAGTHKDLVLSLTNHSTEMADLLCTSKAGQVKRTIRLAPKQTRTIAFDLAENAMWYDITVSARDEEDFLLQLAGHVETTHPSKTDIAMGNRSKI